LATSQHAPGGSHGRFSELLWVDSQTSEPFLNAVTPLTSDRAPGPAVIERALQACAETPSPFSWWFHDHLPPAAAAAGFEVVEPTALMSLAIADKDRYPGENGLVSTGHDLTEFFAAASAGFEDNVLEVSSLVQVFEPLVGAGTVVPLVVRDSGSVVGTLLLHLGDAEPSRAGIYWVSTMPRFRGNGVASSLVKHAVQQAGTARRTHVVLQSSLMAEHIYQQLGFSLQGYMGIAERGAD
jgi:ribosomal protein S18 acetylase RimI-like enzyme